MAKVKTLRAHRNGYGKKTEKEPGDVYNHPSPSYLVRYKFVELVLSSKAKKKPPIPKSKQ